MILTNILLVLSIIVMCFLHITSKKLEKYYKKELDTKKKENIELTNLYESQCSSVKTIVANCITNNKNSNSEIMAKDCLCQELAKQLLPYINYERYVIADGYCNEEKHIATIKIMDEET